MKLTRVFAPGVNTMGVNFGVLALRVWVGATMLLAHGWSKLMHLSDTARNLGDPIHLGAPLSTALMVFAEVACSALLLVGFVTRFAAGVLIINMLVAFVVVHGMSVKGGELAFLYLGAYVTLLLAGPGQFSADAAVFSK